MDKRIEVLFLKAKQAEKTGDWSGAEALYRTVLKVMPNNVRAQHALVQLAARSRTAPPQPQAELPSKQDMAELFELFRLRKDAEAAARAETLYARHPAAVALLGLLGVAQGRLGQSEAAITTFRRAIAISPGYADAHFNLGNALLNRGRFEEAIDSYRSALAGQPKNHGAYNNLGDALSELGRLDEAEAAFRKALALWPDYFEAHYNLGNTLRAQGRLEEAIAAYRQALLLRPASADLHTNLGNALREQGDCDGAVATFREVTAIKPDSAQGYYNLGNALVERGSLDEAVSVFRQALAIAPDYAEAWNNLGDALLQQDEVDEAETAFDRALALRPGYANAHNGIGNVHKLRGEYEAAVEALERALAIRPDYVEAFCNLGNVLAEQGRFDEAGAAYQAALAHQPELDRAHLALGVIDLLRGDLAKGLRGYERRRTRPGQTGSRVFSEPLWLGREDVGGKTVFVHHEQGLGDAIQFVRYVPMLRERGARVILSVHPPLRSLISDSLTDVKIGADGHAPAAFDYQIPMLSLPLAFGTTLDTIPAQVPYLFAREDRVRRWQERLGAQGFRIGVCWQGRSGKEDRGRSFPLARLQAIAALPDVRLISLHKGEGERQLSALPEGMNVELLGPDFDAGGSAFLDTAAVMQSCDLVISSDTAVAHLAGALGVPVWVMLKRVPDWRWLMDRTDSPWYPTMRLFRQPHAGEWEAAFAEAEESLQMLLGQRRSLLPSYSGNVST